MSHILLHREFLGKNKIKKFSFSEIAVDIRINGGMSHYRHVYSNTHLDIAIY